MQHSFPSSTMHLTVVMGVQTSWSHVSSAPLTEVSLTHPPPTQPHSARGPWSGPSDEV